MGEWVSLDNGSEDVDSLYEATTEAFFIKLKSIVAIHSSLNSKEILVRLVEPEVDGLIVDQVGNCCEVMLEWFLFRIKAIPELFIICERIIFIIALIALGMCAKGEQGH